MRYSYLICPVLAIFLLFGPSLRAQKQKGKFKKANVVQLNDSLGSYSQSDIFDFPNVNKVALFYNEAKANTIKKLDNSGQEEPLYKELKDYVHRFGVLNFSRNVPMLWRLAQLSEKFGPKGEAELLYKLLLKHHQQGIDIHDLTRRYDSVNRDKKELYVPLDYYYQLVEYRKDIDTLRPPHAVLTNMGDDLNSQSEDYGPTIGNVDYLMLFTSKRNWHDAGFQRTFDEDLFYSLRIDGQWQKAKEFAKVNTSYNEGSACISRDGKTLIFSRCNAADSHGNCDLYMATLTADSTWSNIKNMGPAINSTGWDSHPSLTPSGDTLYFASNRVGGFGLSDIYYSIRDKKGDWSKGINLGPVINTIQSEVSPFFHHAHSVLYFSSNGHPLNFGDFDIYKTYKRKGVWEEPRNIGPLVNGAGSEYYFTIDSKSHELFYARSESEDKKNLDLYSFPVPMEAQPLATAQLRGSLKDENGKTLKGIVSVIDLDEGIEVAPKFLREDGTFDFNLINKRNYLLVIQGDEFFRIEEVFFLDGEKEINKIAEPIESKIAFESLEFENGKADILPAMHLDLNKLGNFLTDHPELKLTISGHTDSAGKEESNLRLSQARADAIKEYLVSGFMIDRERVAAIGYGSSRPIAQELSDDHKQLNRRVEFEITRM